MVDTKLFQNFITCCILVAAALVGMQTYEDLEEDLHDFFIIADAIILAIFTVECALKLVAEGKRPQDYFKHAWNVFDFVVVFACYMPFGGSAVAVLRLLRLLRVLKLFNNIPELQIILSGLAKGMSSVSYIGLLMFLLFYVFGIISVQFFRCDPHP
jgi:voltage-gated sodium channel